MAKAKTITQLRQDTERWVRYWQKRGIAREWEITVIPSDLQNGDAGAGINWADDYRHAALRVNTHLDPDNDYDYRSPRHFSRAILHELLHLAAAPMTDYIDSNFIHGSPFRLEFSRRVETVVDGLATAIYRLNEGKP